MDVRERADEFLEAISAALDAKQSDMWTAFPVKFEKFDHEKVTATVQPTIKSPIREWGGKTTMQDLPQIADAPVYFQGAGGYTQTHPVKQGDEGIAIIASRAIDRWHRDSDVQPQSIGRKHDLSDAMILPGVRSLPRAKKLRGGVSRDSAQNRSDDGEHIYDISTERGLTHQSSKDVNARADRNVVSDARESITHKAGRNVETAAGGAIRKSSPMILLNSGAAQAGTVQDVAPQGGSGGSQAPSGTPSKAQATVPGSTGT